MDTETSTVIQKVQSSILNLVDRTGGIVINVTHKQAYVGKCKMPLWNLQKLQFDDIGNFKIDLLIPFESPLTIYLIP